MVDSCTAWIKLDVYVLFFCLIEFLNAWFPPQAAPKNIKEPQRFIPSWNPALESGQDRWYPREELQNKSPYLIFQHLYTWHALNLCCVVGHKHTTPPLSYITPCVLHNLSLCTIKIKKELFLFSSKLQNRKGMKRPFRDLPANDQRQGNSDIPSRQWLDRYDTSIYEMSVIILGSVFSAELSSVWKWYPVPRWAA